MDLEGMGPGSLCGWVLVAVLSASLTMGCGEHTIAPNPELIDRDVFIAVYADLRVGALRSPGQEITAEGRDAVLQRYGVTSDNLLDFADYYGPDIAYMRDVWNDVEVRLDSIRSASAGPSPGDTAR